MRRSRRGFRLTGHRRTRAVSEIFTAVLLVAITVILCLLIYTIRFPLTPAPPTISYQAISGGTRPVWGDPTDCHPLNYNASTYLVPYNPTKYTEYMNAWKADCENGDDGVYNEMNVSAIEITNVPVPIPLDEVEFQFVCTNQTPKFVQTDLVQGLLSSMDWVPGSNQTLSSTAPTLGKCATYDASGKGANSVYYNRLGYFDPVDYLRTNLAPGQTIIIYIHTPDSVLEAPNQVTPAADWNISDSDDYHGAPPWCFTVPGACEINLIDLQFNPAVTLTTIPLYVL